MLEFFIPSHWTRTVSFNERSTPYALRSLFKLSQPPCCSHAALTPFILFIIGSEKYAKKIKGKNNVQSVSSFPAKHYLPPSALPVTFLNRFTVSSTRPSPSGVGILFDPLTPSYRGMKNTRKKKKRALEFSKTLS